MVALTDFWKVLEDAPDLDNCPLSCQHEDRFRDATLDDLAEEWPVWLLTPEGYVWGPCLDYTPLDDGSILYRGEQWMPSIIFVECAAPLPHRPQATAISRSGDVVDVEVLQLFDYQALDAETRIIVQQHTHDLREKFDAFKLNVHQIGTRLIEVKARLGHGHFGNWLEVEFDLNPRTAQRFMNVASRFKSETVSDLNLSQTVIYLLAAPSTPDEVVAEVLEEARNGHKPTVDEIKQKSRLRSGGGGSQASRKPRPSLPPPERTGDTDTPLEVGDTVEIASMRHGESFRGCHVEVAAVNDLQLTALLADGQTRTFERSEVWLVARTQHFKGRGPFTHTPPCQPSPNTPATQPPDDTRPGHASHGTREAQAPEEPDPDPDDDPGYPPDIYRDDIDPDDEDLDRELLRSDDEDDPGEDLDTDFDISSPLLAWVNRALDAEALVEDMQAAQPAHLEQALENIESIQEQLKLEQQVITELRQDSDSLACTRQDLACADARIDALEQERDRLRDALADKTVITHGSGSGHHQAGDGQAEALSAHIRRYYLGHRDQQGGKLCPCELCSSTRYLLNHRAPSVRRV